jgi:hypothetical protein
VRCWPLLPRSRELCCDSHTRIHARTHTGSIDNQTNSWYGCYTSNHASSSSSVYTWTHNNSQSGTIKHIIFPFQTSVVHMNDPILFPRLEVCLFR